MSGSWFAKLCAFPWWLRLMGFLAAVALVVAASTANPDLAATPLLSPYLHNLMHAPLFGVLAMSFLVLLGRRAPLLPWVWASTLFLVLIAGYLDEWHQLSVPGRGSDLRDVVTDLLGGLFSLILAACAAHHPARLRRHLLPVVSCLAALLLWGWFATEGPLLPLPWTNP